MNRLEALSAWFFTLLGVLLLGASVLVVPERAFGSSLIPDPCDQACCQALYGTDTCDQTTEFNACKSDCDACVVACGCNPTQSCIDGCTGTGGSLPCRLSNFVCVGKNNETACNAYGICQASCKCKWVTDTCFCQTY